jgi:hypothetical protein
MYPVTPQACSVATALRLLLKERMVNSRNRETLAVLETT